MKSILKLLSTFLLTFLVAMIVDTQASFAADGQIYVIHEANGVMRFTTTPPKNGEAAQVFTARASGFRYIQGAGRRMQRSRKLYPDLFARAILQAARQHRVDPNLIKAVIHVESGFNPTAVSPKGARGLMQLMPGTARMMGVRNSFVPEWNIEGGTQYLARLLRRYGNESHALAAYNAGDLPVQRYNGIPPYAETQEYVRRVLYLKKQYSAVSHG